MNRSSAIVLTVALGAAAVAVHQKVFKKISLGSLTSWVCHTTKKVEPVAGAPTSDASTETSSCALTAPKSYKPLAHRVYLDPELQFSGASVMQELGVTVCSTPEEATIIVNHNPDVDPATHFAYAALHAWSTNQELAPLNPKFLPMHNEQEHQRSGRPYINTLALARAPEVYAAVIYHMAALVKDLGATVVVGFEARAMAFALPIAYVLRVPFVPARAVKDTHGAALITGEVKDKSSWRSGTEIALDGDTLHNEDVPVIVDDVVNSGGTVKALWEVLVTKCEKAPRTAVVLYNFNGDYCAPYTF